MSPSPTDLPQRLLRTPEAARYLGLSGRTLEKHRTYGTGPLYRKLGGRVVYTVTDLDAWANRGKRASTSDPGTDTVLPARWPEGHGPAATSGATARPAPGLAPSTPRSTTTR